MANALIKFSLVLALVSASLVVAVDDPCTLHNCTACEAAAKKNECETCGYFYDSDDMAPSIAMCVKKDTCATQKPLPNFLALVPAEQRAKKVEFKVIPTCNRTTLLPESAPLDCPACIDAAGAFCSLESAVGAGGLCLAPTDKKMCEDSFGYSNPVMVTDKTKCPATVSCSDAPGLCEATKGCQFCNMYFEESGKKTPEPLDVGICLRDGVCNSLNETVGSVLNVFPRGVKKVDFAPLTGSSKDKNTLPYSIYEVPDCSSCESAEYNYCSFKNKYGRGGVCIGRIDGKECQTVADYVTKLSKSNTTETAFSGTATCPTPYRSAAAPIAGLVATAGAALLAIFTQL